VYNTPDRVNEYTQVADPSIGGGGRADLYARFLLEELKPVIDARYRTLPGPDATGVAGSSLGGLVSLYFALAYPETFSRCGVVSPAVWWASAEIFNWVRGPRSPRSRLWLDMGTAEGKSARVTERLLKGVRSLRDALTSCGWTLGETLHYLEAEGAQHNESAWGARVEPMLQFLFPSRSDASVASEGAVEIPIDGTLDLHTFSPRDVKRLIPDYIGACRDSGITRVRIIHGKGTGTLRRTVHAILEKVPEVVSFRLASDDASGWGATIVTLRERRP
jgi:pimeloyl-ACP methyl ester carboxylesterase